MKIWPWTRFADMQVQIDLLQSALEEARHDHLDAQKGHLEALKALETERQARQAHEGNLRQMALIMHMRGLDKVALTFLFLFFCLSGFGQGFTRQSFTTNTDPSAVVRSWKANQYFPAIIIPTNNPAYSNAVFIGKSLSAVIGQYQVEQFTGSTNNGAVQAGVYLGHTITSTDGALLYLLDFENAIGFTGRPYYLSPERWITNTTAADSVFIGHPPGWGLIGTNTASTPKFNMVFIDSSYIAVASCPYLKLLTGSSIMDAYGTLLALTNCNGSTLIGPFMPALPSSTNDAMLNALGSSWTGNSHDNTFLGACLPNSTHGNGSIVIGSGVDLPVDGTDNQLNIGNLIWGTGLNQNNAVAANGTVTINGSISLKSAASIITGAGSPAGSVAAPVGSIYLNTSGGAGTTLYVKESGGSTSAGWIGK